MINIYIYIIVHNNSREEKYFFYERKSFKSIKKYKKNARAFRLSTIWSFRRNACFNEMWCAFLTLDLCENYDGGAPEGGEIRVCQKSRTRRLRRCPTTRTEMCPTVITQRQCSCKCGSAICLWADSYCLRLSKRTGGVWRQWKNGASEGNNVPNEHDLYQFSDAFSSGFPNVIGFACNGQKNIVKPQNRFFFFFVRHHVSSAAWRFAAATCVRAR